MNKRKQTGNKVNKNPYYIAESASEQNEANPSFWLATQKGKILRISRVRPVNKSSLLGWFRLCSISAALSGLAEKRRAVCSGEEGGLIFWTVAGNLACLACRFWLLSNKGGRGQKNREEIGAGATYFSRGFAARAPGSTKPPCYAGYW